MNLPIDIETFEFSTTEQLKSDFKHWRLRGAEADLTILSTSQSSWVSGGEVKHILTVLYQWSSVK